MPASVHSLILDAAREHQAMLPARAEDVNLVDKGIAQRQAASRYLHDLAALGVLREMPFGKEKLFVHPKLMQLLGRDNNQFQPYA